MLSITQRLALAKQALTGLSIGDAFGESFFGPHEQIQEALTTQQVPESTWEFTDDTIMALSVFEQLEQHQSIQQDALVQAFIAKHELDPNRGYGATVRRLLRAIEGGGLWSDLAPAVFDDMGSMGNGAAMRVASIGAYFTDDLERVALEAERSAVVTHANNEAVAGAVAVAIASALAAQVSLGADPLEPKDFLQTIKAYLPDSDTKSKLNKALHLSANFSAASLRTVLGNGTQMLAQDTVPVAIWCAAHHLVDFEKALWRAVGVLGDRDTICAIVGGIVALSAPKFTIPTTWRQAVESIWDSPFRTKIKS